MAIDPTNYINTWNNSSVLQQQFPDVNDYVDLFGSVSTPTSTPIATPTPIIPEQGIPSIINSQMNIDDSGDQGITGPTGPSFGPVTGQGNVSKTDIVGSPLDQITRGVKGIADFYGKYSPINLAKKGVTYTFDKYNAFVNAREARNQVTKDVFNRQMEKQLADDLARQDAMDIAQEEIDRMGYKDYGQGAATGGGGYNDGDGGSYSGDSTQDYGGGEKDGGFIDGANRRKDFADGGMTESSGIYGLLRRGIKNIEDGGYIDGSNRRKDFEIGGPVGQERKLTDYIEPNIKAQTGSSTPVPGVNIDQESYEYILKLKIPLDEKLKLIAEFGGNKSITEIDDSELASRYGVKKGADIYKGGSSNKRFGAEYINDGLTFGGRYDPDSGNKNLYISKRFQDGGLATMFKLK